MYHPGAGQFNCYYTHCSSHNFMPPVESVALWREWLTECTCVRIDALNFGFDVVLFGPSVRVFLGTGHTVYVSTDLTLCYMSKLVFWLGLVIGLVN